MGIVEEVVGAGDVEAEGQAESARKYESRNSGADEEAPCRSGSARQET